MIDDAFLEKYQIDYVAHDEENYASAGHEDVYHYVKSIGMFSYTHSGSTFAHNYQVNSYLPDAHQVSLRPTF